jgi:hypothetical protein
MFRFFQSKMLILPLLLEHEIWDCNLLDCGVICNYYCFGVIYCHSSPTLKMEKVGSSERFTPTCSLWNQLWFFQAQLLGAHLIFICYTVIISDSWRAAGIWWTHGSLLWSPTACQYSGTVGKCSSFILWDFNNGVKTALLRLNHTSKSHYP